jgi:hypothetical protein
MINQINKIIFKYLDKQNFVLIDNTDKIYFVNSEGDEYSQIRYDKNYGCCYIYYDLVKEISSFFSMKESDSEKVIGIWVEDVLQMRLTNTLYNKIRKFINTKWVMVQVCLTIENIRPMKVINSQSSQSNHILRMTIPCQ